MRLDVEIVRDTREACGPDYTIIFHLSLLDLVEGGSTWEEVKALAQTLEDAGMIMLNRISAITPLIFLPIWCTSWCHQLRSCLQT